MINTLLPDIRGSAFFNRSVDAGMIREDLLSQEMNRQLNAVKQVLAFMTIGKDMSMHFNDVANLLSTTNLQLKKLVYLYLIQNSKSHPEKAVLQAGTFAHDMQHESPLVRGMALRTMSSMGIVAMTDFLTNPTLRCLRDADPYVRRTAVFAALKLFAMSPNTFFENGFGVALVGLLADPIASVVASVAAVLTELLQSAAQVPAMVSLATAMHQKIQTLLAATSDCSEWQQFYLLDAVGHLLQQKHIAATISLDDAELIVGRVSPLLASLNAAVVSAAIKVVCMFMLSYLPAVAAGGGQSPMRMAQFEAKLAPRVVPPLMSLVMASRNEMRFVAIKTIQLLIGIPRMRDAFIQFLSSFLVKFDDAVYLKMEKLDILVGLSNKNNWPVVVSELVEYTTEVDVDFVKKAVRSLGLIAVRVEPAASTCVEKLMTLLETRCTYIVQEAAVVVQLILRQYRDRFDGVIAKLCTALSVLDDPESKAAVAWVIGEFADRVANAADVLTLFFEGFLEESASVQLAVVTAVAKAFLSCTDADPRRLQKMLEECLSVATRSDHPDVRDRAYFYWRLIIADPHAAKEVVITTKPVMSDFSCMERSVLQELVAEVGCLSATLHRPSKLLFTDAQVVPIVDDGDADVIDGDGIASLSGGSAGQTDVLYNADGSAVTSPNVPRVSPTANGAALSLSAAAAAASSGASSSGLEFVTVLPSTASGIQVAMAWSQSGTFPMAHFRFSLAPAGSLSSSAASAAVPLSQVKVTMVQINVNIYGLGIAQEVAPVDVKAGQTVQMSLAVNCNNGRRPVRDIQTAVKVEPIGALYFNAPPIPIPYVLLPATGAVDPAAYVTAVKSLSPSWHLPANLENKYKTNASRLHANTLKVHNVALVHQKEVDNRLGLHLYCETIARQKLYIELIVIDSRISSLIVRSSDENVSHVIGEHILAVVAA